MSTISLRAEIERRISEALPARLLDISMDYHCRKGLRPGCTCEVCAIKRSSHRLFSMDRTQDHTTIAVITNGNRLYVRELLDRTKPTL